LTVIDFFHLLVALHIVGGASAAIAFWIPVASRKGGPAHRKAGRYFARAMLATGAIACCMAVTTLVFPVETHPHLAAVPGFGEPQPIRDIFGWMMLYLGILTINLAWQGWLCAAPGRTIEAARDWRNVSLQVALTLAASVCAWRGFAGAQPLMMAISLVGFATVGTNVHFLMRARPTRAEWVREHIKAIVGAGISVYTAFFAFGSVRLVPALALNPAMWAVPLTVGMALILWHRRAVALQASRARMAAGE